jgi:exoribonuclease R
MPTEKIFIVHPANEEQVNALKAFVKALKIKFEITSEKTYNPDFVAKIQKSKKEIEEAKVTRVENDDLKQFLGIKGVTT